MTEAIQITPATPSHASEIFVIAAEARLTPSNADSQRGFLILPGLPEWWAQALSESSASFVATEHGRVVGFVYALIEEDGQLLKIDRIAVLPTHTRRGIAQRLLDAATAAARAPCAYALIMHAPVTNRRSIAFFRDRNGYRRTGTTQRIASCTLSRYERAQLPPG